MFCRRVPPVGQLKNPEESYIKVIGTVECKSLYPPPHGEEKFNVTTFRMENVTLSIPRRNARIVWNAFHQTTGRFPVLLPGHCISRSLLFSFFFPFQFFFCPDDMSLIPISVLNARPTFMTSELWDLRSGIVHHHKTLSAVFQDNKPSLPEFLLDMRCDSQDNYILSGTLAVQ